MLCYHSCVYTYTCLYVIHIAERGCRRCPGARGARPCLTGWKINYPEIGYPEFCQLIEQENRDPNKALGQSIKITVYLEFAF